MLPTSLRSIPALSQNENFLRNQGPPRRNEAAPAGTRQEEVARLAQTHLGPANNRARNAQGVRRFVARAIHLAERIGPQERREPTPERLHVARTTR